MSNLLAHLARRALIPSSIRPRTPSRFETPTAAPLSEIEVERETPPRSENPPSENERRPVAVDKAEYKPAPRAARPGVETAIPPAPPVVRMLVPSPPPLHDSPESPGTRVSEKPYPVDKPAAPTVVERISEQERTIHKTNTETRILEREIQREQREKTILSERLELRTERLTPEPAAIATTAAPPAEPQRGPDNAPLATPPVEAPARVEIHIGRIEVLPAPGATTFPVSKVEEPRRAKPLSLEAYLSDRSRSPRSRGGLS